MPILADTHVHLYPSYRMGKTFLRLAGNLDRLAAAAGASAAARVALLTERQGQHAFRDLRDGLTRLERDDVALATTPDPGALQAILPGAALHVLAGRQVITAERLEVLALAADLDLPDGLPAAEAVARILAAGGVPVLPWAPGKWFFHRGRVVAGLLARFTPDQLLLGDTTLRPLGWGEPRPMRAGRARGFRTIAGTDPLPFAADDVVAGTYATLFDAPFDPEHPVASVRAALRQAQPPPRLLGRRGTPLQVARRLWRHSRAKPLAI